MKYFEALRIYNEGKQAWCSPRKGTDDYNEVITIMKSKLKPLIKTDFKRPIRKRIKVPIKSPQLSPLYKEADVSSKKPSSKSLLFNKANIIQRFLKNKLILTKNNLDTRVQRYYLIKKRFEQLTGKECLTKKMFGNNQGYTLDGIVNLEKKIGSDSVYGSIYLTSMPHLLGSYPIASKVMEITSSNDDETKMNMWITENLILQKQSKHFVMMYKTTKCPLNQSKINKLLKKQRLVDYNELCNGDLSSLMKTEVRNDDEIMINLAFQVFIAIATYQNRVGFVHRDAHHGNFLYQLNNEVGYYHYIYNGLDFYVKSCKYNMFIFDFGLSKSIKNVDNDIKYIDYYMILQAFISKKKGFGWIEDDMDINVNINMISIRNALINIYSKIYTDKFFDMFGRIIEDIFKKFKTNTGIFTTSKPANILNKIPFIINKVKEYPNINFNKM
jgi:hypothetical protein